MRNNRLSRITSALGISLMSLVGCSQVSLQNPEFRVPIQKYADKKFEKGNSMNLYEAAEAYFMIGEYEKVYKASNMMLEQGDFRGLTYLNKLKEVAEKDPSIMERLH